MTETRGIFYLFTLVPSYFLKINGISINETIIMNMYDVLLFRLKMIPIC